MASKFAQQTAIQVDHPPLLQVSACNAAARLMGLPDQCRPLQAPWAHLTARLPSTLFINAATCKAAQMQWLTENIR